MQKFILIILFLVYTGSAWAQDSTYQYVAGIRLAGRISIDYGNGSKWKLFKEVYPDQTGKAETDLDVVIAMTGKGWEFVSALPLFQTYSASYIPLLFRKKR
jgi:hypothetical protein